MSSKIDFRKLTVGSRLRIKGGHTCSVLNVYGTGSIEALLDDTANTIKSIDKEDLLSIDLTPEILICLGFGIRYGGTWGYSMDHMGEYVISITKTDFYPERPWMVTIADSLTGDVAGSGPVANVHELQGLVYNVTDLPLEPVGTLETTIRLMDERQSVMDVFNDIMDIVDEHLDKKDPWWQIFGKIIDHDGGSDYALFNYEYRYNYVEYLDMFMIETGGNDTFEEIWEYNEDYIIMEYYDGQSPDLEELYMQNIMMLVIYACCTEDPEPYQWIMKSLE